MRHVIVSLVCTFLVIAYSIFNYFYVTDFTTEIKSDLIVIKQQNYTTTDKLRETYENKKNVLMFILNKEHLEKLDDSIINLETAAAYGDIQNIELNLKMIKSTVTDIEHHNKCII